MTDPRETLARIRKRADAATEGPWEWEGEAKGEWEIGANSLVPSRRPDDPVLYGYGYDASGIEVSNDADAQFIALMMTGISRTGYPPKEPMPQFHMTQTDAEAVLAYLKSIGY